MIKQLSALRFVLILMIFFHHLQLFQGGGAVGVASFFVLSGFCMTLGYKDVILNEEGFDYLGFLKKRAVKFFPMHWICLLIVLLSPLRGDVFPNVHVLASNIALLQSWIPKEDYYFSYNALSWYLSDTLFLSAVFPPILMFVGNQRKKVLKMFLVLLLGVYLAFLLAVPPSMRHALLYINPLCRAFDFIIGIFTALFYLNYRDKDIVVKFFREHKYLPDIVVVTSILGLILLSSIIDENHLPIAGFFWPLIVVMILAFAFQQDTFFSTVLKSKGVQVATQSTFSFYMIHVICRKQIELLYPYLSGFTKVVVVFIATYILSQLLYYIIEKYFTVHLQSWLIRNK